MRRAMRETRNYIPQPSCPFPTGSIRRSRHAAVNSAGRSRQESGASIRSRRLILTCRCQPTETDTWSDRHLVGSLRAFA